MSDSDELEAIRQRKRERLQARLNGEEPEESETTSAPTEPIHVEGPDHLDEVVATYDVVLVDFYADWCGPCKMLEPIVESLAAKTEAAVAKVDIDAYQSLAAQYNVQGVPTMVLFAEGSPAERVVGVRGEDELASLVRKHR